MKKIILASLVILSALVSCKKDSTTAPVCEKTVAGIAANYKITKVEVVNGSSATDITTTVLDACKLGAIIQLKTDGSIVYTEVGSSCTGSGTGTWAVAANTISIAVTGAPFNVTGASITSWDCSTLVVTDASATPDARYTFTKQ
jgi:hypothetical protein